MRSELLPSPPSIPLTAISNRVHRAVRRTCANPHACPTKETDMDIDIHERAPEQKAGVPAEALSTDDVMRIFESYKQENEVRLADLARRKPDPLTEERLTAISPIRKIAGVRE